VGFIDFVAGTSQINRFLLMEKVHWLIARRLQLVPATGQSATIGRHPSIGISRINARSTRSANSQRLGDFAEVPRTAA
jgi:hypothetical protein